MAAAATDPSTFPLFSSLAPELRNQIWRNALPSKVGPALYLYRRGCWWPRRLSESDGGYDTENDENNLNFEFRHDLLDDVPFEVPLVFVNREARGIALSWVREQGVEICTRKDRQYPLFVRPFDPMGDALYIAPDKWDDFLCEPDDRLSEPDLIGQLVDIRSDVTHVAVPEMFRYFFNLNVLFVIVNAPPDLRPAGNGMEVQWRWEFESTRGGAFFWNNDRGSFDFGDSEYVGDEALHKLIEEANKGLGEGLVQNLIRSFEVRSVFAVRR